MGRVTETFDFDGGRQVTADRPADPSQAVVFAGDGQMTSPWERSSRHPVGRPP